MSDKTGIQWTDATWNPVSGCSKVSPGCKNCYAERDWARLSKNPSLKEYFGRAFTDVRCHPERLQQPLRWRRPRRIFVNSMSDLFHEEVPDDFFDRAFSVMASAREHTFQILTKRPERMREYLSRFKPSPPRDGFITRDGKRSNDLARGEFCAGPERWPLPNVWLGVSVEDQATADERIPILLQTPAALRFASVEPLLDRVTLDGLMIGDETYLDALRGVEGATCQHLAVEPKRGNHLDWVIVGGESGPRARECRLEWIGSLVSQCCRAGVPCFVKQIGSAPASYDADWNATLVRDAKGGDPAEWPAYLRECREFPR
jgi:protein gp37